MRSNNGRAPLPPLRMARRPGGLPYGYPPHYPGRMPMPMPMPMPGQYHDDNYSDSDSNNSSTANKNGSDFLQVERTEMVIHSPWLLAALNAVVGYYPGVDFAGEVGVVNAPYKVLVHHREELERYKTQQPACHDKEYREMVVKHVDVLLEYLRGAFGERLEAEARRRYVYLCFSTPCLFFAPV